MPQTDIAAEQRERAALRLVHDYAEVVDSKDLDAWIELFAEEASYIVTSQDNLARRAGERSPIGYVHDHTKDRIHDRVTLIRQAWAGHYDDYQPRHVLSSVAVDVGEDGDTASARTGLAIYVTEPNIPGSRLLAVGEYRDEIVFTDEGARFASKLLVLDTNVLPRYFIYPL
jgi:salicylate 5-hydroxylase small subunit